MGKPWEPGFMGVGGMRGIGWVVLTRDPVNGAAVQCVDVGHSSTRPFQRQERL